MTDEQPNAVGVVLQLLMDQVVALSARHAALRDVLETHGGVSSAEYDAALAAIRTRWALLQEPRSDEAFVAALREALAGTSGGDDSVLEGGA